MKQLLKASNCGDVCRQPEVQLQGWGLDVRLLRSFTFVSLFTSFCVSIGCSCIIPEISQTAGRTHHSSSAFENLCGVYLHIQRHACECEYDCVCVHRLSTTDPSISDLADG